MEGIGNIRHPFPQIILEEILEFRSELNTSRASSDNNLGYTIGNQNP